MFKYLNFIKNVLQKNRSNANMKRDKENGTHKRKRERERESERERDAHKKKQGYYKERISAIEQTLLTKIISVHW